MPETVNIPITSCKDCPFVNIQRCQTEDSWEKAFDWFCSKAENKKIEGYIEWREVDDVKIPKWCPLRTQKKKIKP